MTIERDVVLVSKLKGLLCSPASRHGPKPF
jgi:hypothetical protein